jgi:serine/threonine protein phosphatase 1
MRVSLPQKTTPPREQIFAIGDVHGQSAALESALACVRNADRELGLKSHLVFTGDIIDRGCKNLQAIELVLKAQELAEVDEVTFLPGNHELIMIDGLRHNSAMIPGWIRLGGATLCAEIAEVLGTEQITPPMVLDHIPDFVALIDQAPNHLRLGDILFVHAGVHPHVPLEEWLARGRYGITRMEDHWAWIREPFLSWTGGFGPDGNLLVVHGHTRHNDGAVVDASNVYALFDFAAVHGRICLDAGTAAGHDQLVVLDMTPEGYRLHPVIGL